MKLAGKYYFSVFRPQAFSHFSTTSLVRKPNEAGKSTCSTVDDQDIGKYSKLTADWWNVRGSVKLLHAMNPLRTKFVRDGLATTGFKEIKPFRPLEGIKLLDVGCGGGIFSESLARMGAQVTGIDASKELIAIAEEHAALDKNLRSNLVYKNITIEDLSKQEKEHYDVVVASEILEHVNNQSLFLTSCSEALKPKGSIFITTLNRNFVSWLGAIVVLEYILRQIPLGTHDWHKFITPDETKLLLDKCNCETKLVEGLFYNPVTNKWPRTSSTAIFYALHAVKKGN